MLLILFSLATTPVAQALDLPLFNIPTSANKQDEVPHDQIKHFRVQVYPHQGAYSTPQGRESSAKTVSVTSTAACAEYETTLDSNLEWTKGKPVTTRTLPTSFHAGRNKTNYFACPQSFVIHRAAPLKSLEYAGDFVVITNSSQVKIINIVDPETYIKGVIPAEVSASWAQDLLKAQAIAARTYAWWTVAQMRKAGSESDMDDTVSYQAYMGKTNQDSRSDAAADSTAHIVMTYNGAIIKSYFSADSGGYTEDASEVFEALPYCKATAEKYDQSLYPASAWTKIFSATELKKVLVQAKLIKATVTIDSVTIEAADRTSSGRARTLQVLGTDKVVYPVDGTEFRFAAKIKSSLFNITKSGQSLVLSGRGFGHGVGMAQIGALQYAEQMHWTYDQILYFYYSGVNLVHD